MNFAKFLRTPFFTEHLWWLLLEGGVLKKFVVEREVKVKVFIVLLDRHTQLVFYYFPFFEHYKFDFEKGIFTYS